MDVTICIGSSCHLKGSRQIVQRLDQLIGKHGLRDQVKLNGSFCMDNCAEGVCVKIGETIYSVQPENVDEFFEHTVLEKLKDPA